MSQSIYCVGKINGSNNHMMVAENSNVPAKRINIVSIRMVREATMLYGTRKISSPEDAVVLGKKLLEDLDREQLIVCCLDTKNQPQALNVVSVGSLDSSIVHPQEKFSSQQS